MSFGTGWYSVALSEGLEPGTSSGVHLFGKEIVVWRDSAGAAHAWEDRCPHRGMRLSFGFVRGDRIACLYHGWQYGTDGQCLYIPAHPDLRVPSAIRTTAFPCIERAGMLWVYSEMEAQAPIDSLPDKAPVTPVRSIYVDRPAQAVADFMLRAELPVISPHDAKPHVTAEYNGSLLSLKFDHVELLAGVQPIAAAKAALHFAVSGAGNDWRGAGQKMVACWTEVLRRDLNAQIAAPSFQG